MTNKKLIGLILLVLGFVLDGFAWSTKLGHPLNTICLLLGLGLIIGGFALLLKIKYISTTMHIKNDGQSRHQ